eukprot:4977279-Prorocentrum_lima.AAC.1
MTSSLVGSEMCIRDSPTAPHNGSATMTMQLFLSMNCPGTSPRCLPTCTSCLLYTSDAADDM